MTKILTIKTIIDCQQIQPSDSPTGQADPEHGTVEVERAFDLTQFQHIMTAQKLSMTSGQSNVRLTYNLHQYNHPDGRFTGVYHSGLLVMMVTWGKDGKPYDTKTYDSPEQKQTGTKQERAFEWLLKMSHQGNAKAMGQTSLEINLHHR